MSFNVRNSGANDGMFAWPHRKDAAVTMLKQEQPDLIGMQEALPDQLQDLDAGLAGEYQRFSRGREADGSGEHSAIYVRRTAGKVLGDGHFWLSETPDVPGSKHWDHHCVRMANFVELEHERWGRYLFINTHLDHQSPLARLKGAELIGVFIQNSGSPAVLTGDMNADPTSEPVQVYSRYGLHDAGFPYANDSSTFHDFGRRRGAVIDYVFHTEHWQTNSCRIITDKPNGMYPSDHYPVLAELTWRTT